MAPFFALLARLAAARPERPWLFFRRDLDWRWRSHRQVADHLARAAAVIRAAGLPAATALPLVGAEALSALLATLAAGIDFVPLEQAPADVPLLTPADAKWPDLVPAGEDRPVVALPAARGNIERYQPAALPTGPYGRLMLPGGALSVEDLDRLAAKIAARLFAEDELSGKKIVHAGARLAGEAAGALLMATLREDTVLALEPYPPATVESVLWCRPTHLVAHADEVAALAEAWTPKDQKRSRLRRVLAVGKVDEAWSRQLGVPVLEFGY